MIIQGILSEVNFQGTAPTVGLVEGVLLLAENLPREKTSNAVNSAADKNVRAVMPLVSPTSEEQKQVISGAENRQAWMLIGNAIRMAYGLGLDQASCMSPERIRSLTFVFWYSSRGRWTAERKLDIGPLLHGHVSPPDSMLRFPT